MVEVGYCLGNELIRDESRFEMTEANPVGIPMDIHDKLKKNTNMVNNDLKFPYKEWIGCLT